MWMDPIPIRTIPHTAPATAPLHIHAAVEHGSQLQVLVGITGCTACQEPAGASLRACHTQAHVQPSAPSPTHTQTQTHTHTHTDTTRTLHSELAPSVSQERRAKPCLEFRAGEGEVQFVHDRPQPSPTLRKFSTLGWGQRCPARAC